MTSVHLKIVLERREGLDRARVTQELRSRGFSVEEDLTEFDMLIGTAEEDTCHALESVDGVEAVEPDRAVTLPPMTGDGPK